MSRGWKRESKRHSLAARGMRTTSKSVVRNMYSKSEWRTELKDLQEDLAVEIRQGLNDIDSALKDSKSELQFQKKQLKGLESDVYSDESTRSVDVERTEDAIEDVKDRIEDLTEQRRYSISKIKRIKKDIQNAKRNFRRVK
jgi:chromosome segregation ATPase